MNFYSNGKLLLTGEYLVLDGAKALAIPTKFGQDLLVEPIQEPELIWASFTNTGDCWFEAFGGRNREGFSVGSEATSLDH